MASTNPQTESPASDLASPVVGTVLTILSGLAFLATAMLLPLVGKSAVQTVHLRANFIAFLCVAVLSLATAILATISKLQRRAMDGSPLPIFSIVLCVLSALLLVALFLGLLSI